MRLVIFVESCPLSIAGEEGGAQEQSAIRCAEILGKISKHEDLYDDYRCETDPEKRDWIGREIIILRGDLRCISSDLFGHFFLG